MALTAYRFPATTSPSDFGEIDDPQYGGILEYIKGRYCGCLEGFSDVGNGLAVTAGTGMQVRVDSGDAVILGGPINNSGSLNKTIAASHGSLDRIDWIVLQQDASLLKTTAATVGVVQGSNSANPVAPGLARSNTGIWQMPLAQVYVGHGVTSITNGVITDWRPQPRKIVPYKAGSTNFNTANIAVADGQVTIAGLPNGVPYPGYDFRLQLAGMFDFTGSTITDGRVNVFGYVGATQVTKGKSNKLANMPALLHTETTSLVFTGPLTDVHVEAAAVSLGSGEHINLSTAFSNFTVDVIPA